MFSDAVTFFKEFIRNPRQLGSVIPSSGFLKRRIIRVAGVANAHTIVELGPGNGGTTRAILAAMPADARLLSIELNEGLYQLNSRITDTRYTAHHGSATDLAEILATHQLPAPDVIISGIPFSTMDKSIARDILHSINKQLAVDGRFVAYQVSDKVRRLNTAANMPCTQETEWLNVPPLRVWCWRK
ncbi:MAG: methyltransferase type 12 [Pseudomonadota bacterium]